MGRDRKWEQVEEEVGCQSQGVEAGPRRQWVEEGEEERGEELGWGESWMQGWPLGEQEVGGLD